MKFIIISSGKFHIKSIIDDLILIENSKIIVVSGSPRFDKRVKHIWIPLIGQILFRKIFKIQQPSWSKLLDFILIDFIASLFIENKSILIGFAGVSLFSGIKCKKKGGLYILDRACPWLPMQNKLIEHEAKLNNIEWIGTSTKIYKRCKKEYEQSSIIKVPSNFSSSSYPSFLKAKVSKYKINVKKINNFSKKRVSEVISIGFIGSNYLRKGTRVLIFALDSIMRDRSNIFLRVKMNRKEFLKTRMSKTFYNKYKRRIIFEGYYNDISELYNKLDVLLLPSIDEGFGMVVFEALQIGVPVIVSSNVGASEYIQNSKFSKVFTNNSSESLSKCILDFIDDFVSVNDSEIQSDCFYLYNSFIKNKIPYVSRDFQI